VVAIAWLAACGGLEDPQPPTALDYEAFSCRVEPVLMARCAFGGCHGTEERPLRLYGPGRYRHGDVPPEEVASPITAAESGANYYMAVGLGDEAEPERSMLLLKPLAAGAGGYLHQATELFADVDVFEDTDDQGYLLLLEWLQGGTAEPGCVPTAGVGP